MLNDVKDIFQKGFDPDFIDYLGDVLDIDEAKQRAIDIWSEALFECAKDIFPASTSSTAARTAFESSAVGMNLDGSVFSAAVAAFASTLGGGMTGYTPTPPPSVFIPTSLNEDHDLMCEDFSDQMIAWFQTGQSTLIVPPNTVEPWT